MAEYYLISQLPSLDGIGENMPLPITNEGFLELCKSFLSKKAMCEIENLTLSPKPDFDKSGSALIQSFNEGESKLRLALSKARAEKLNKAVENKNENIPAELVKLANAAVEIDNPLEAEIFLLNYRLNLLEALRPIDNFSEDYLFYYGLKLKLLTRVRKFDKNLGETTYKNIYNSIMNGDSMEAKIWPRILVRL